MTTVITVAFFVCLNIVTDLSERLIILKLAALYSSILFSNNLFVVVDTLTFHPL